jgi:hypothetical protein
MVEMQLNIVRPAGRPVTATCASSMLLCLWTGIKAINLYLNDELLTPAQKAQHISLSIHSEIISSVVRSGVSRSGYTPDKMMCMMNEEGFEVQLVSHGVVFDVLKALRQNTLYHDSFVFGCSVNRQILLDASNTWAKRTYS